MSTVTTTLSAAFGNQTLAGAFTTTNDNFDVIDVSLTSSQANKEHALAFTSTNLKGLWIVMDKAGTVKTNSSGSPQETITLVANVPFFWCNTNYIVYPFAGAVTTLFFTNSIASVATGSIWSVRDGTP